MIIAFVGTPGSGKSYDSVKKILDNLQKGKVVYTNIDGMDSPNCREHIKNYCGLSDLALEIYLKHLNNEEAQSFWLHCAPGSLIVIDEVHKLFCNRDWQTQKNRDFANWASTHRHHGYDVVLITQALEKVDSHVQSLVEWTYVYRKVNFFGGAVQKKYLCYAYSGDDTSGQPLQKHVRTYDSGVFPCYQSYATKDTKELGFMQHVNILKHPVFYLIPVVLCFTLYMFFGKSSFASGDVFGTGAKLKQADAQARQITGKKSKSGSVPSAGDSPHVPDKVVPVVTFKDSQGNLCFSNTTALIRRN